MVWRTVAHMSNIATLPLVDDRPINRRVGYNVRIIMQLRGRTQLDLAKAIGVTESSMSRRIAGRTDWAPDEMQRVADVLSVSVARLFEELPDLGDGVGPDGLEPPTSSVEERRFDIVSENVSRIRRPLHEQATSEADETELTRARVVKPVARIGAVS